MATGYGDTISASPVDKYFHNLVGNAILARGTVANIPTGAGYAVGCLYQASDTGNNYVNTGSITAAVFTLLDAGTAFGLPTSATDATSTTGDSFLLTETTLTTGNAIRVAVTTAVFTTGGAVFNAAMSAVTAGNGFVATTTGVYTGTGLLLLTASSATTGVIAGIVTTSSKALIVGQAAATPAFQVDASTASQIAGLKVTGAVTGGTVALAAIDSGAATNISFDAKGAGLITIGATSTGYVSIGRGSLKSLFSAVTITDLGTNQNSTPTAAQLLGGVLTQASTVGAGTVTLPSGTTLSTAVSGVTVGDTFTVILSNTGSQTLTITGATGTTVVGTATVATATTVKMTFVNTGSNTWNIYTGK